MAQRDTGEELRTRILDAAAETIATEGPSALNLRRLAHDVGTSTMALYTHFGGMPGLRRAVRQEGFARLRAGLAEVEPTADAVGDVAAIGLVYFRNAVENPHLYRVMFMEQPLDEEDGAVGWRVFEVLLDAVQRCIDDRRFKSGTARGIATQLWAMEHGLVALHLATLLDGDEAQQSLANAAYRLFVSYGDKPARASKALAEALARQTELHSL